MTDDREQYDREDRGDNVPHPPSDDLSDPADMPFSDDENAHLPDDVGDIDYTDEANDDPDAGVDPGLEPDTPLLSAEQFEDELARLGALVSDDDPQGDLADDDTGWDVDAEHDGLDSGYTADESGTDEVDDAAGELLATEAYAAAGVEHAAESPLADEETDGVAELDQDDRLRQPRAHSFRQRWRMQLGLLPLALFLIALGVFLLAREQGVGDLPAFTDAEIGVAAVLVVAFTFVFHALLFGRRERGLLFLGLWVWVTTGAIIGLVEGIEPEPDASEWWPLLLASLAATLLLTYIVERTHDVRLVLLAIVVGVAAATAYWVTSGEFDQNLLDDAADYWPLLFSILGIGLVPLVFRRRTG